MELRIRYLSDLHLEFIDHTDIDRFTEKIKPGAEDEICILAGDVCTAFHKDTFHGNYDALMQDISKKFSKTFVISGNHEYYSKVKSMADTDARLEAYFQEFDNISFYIIHTNIIRIIVLLELHCGPILQTRNIK